MNIIINYISGETILEYVETNNNINFKKLNEKLLNFNISIYILLFNNQKYLNLDYDNIKIIDIINDDNDNDNNNKFYITLINLDIADNIKKILLDEKKYYTRYANITYNEIKNHDILISHIFKKYSRWYLYLPLEIKTNKEFLIKAIDANIETLKHATDLKKDKNTISHLIDIYGNQILYYTSNSLKKNKEFIIFLLKKDKYKLNIDILRYIDENLKNDNIFISNLIRINEKTFLYASQSLKENKKFIYQIIKINLFTIQYIDPLLKYDLEFFSNLININPLALEFASDELKNNIDIVFNAITINPLALEFASDELKNNIDIVSNAITNNPLALEFASDEIKNNINIVFNAITINPLALEFASDEIKNNYDINSNTIRNNNLALEITSY